MSEAKKTPTPRLLAAANEFNIGKETLIEFLGGKGFQIDSKPSTKLTEDMYYALEEEYAKDKAAKRKSESIELPKGSLVNQVSVSDDKNIKATSENKLELNTPVNIVGKPETIKKKEEPKEVAKKEEDTPAKEVEATAPVKEAPAKEAPVKEKPVAEKPVKEVTAKETPAKEVPAKETPAKEAPSKETPAVAKTTKAASVSEEPPVAKETPEVPIHIEKEAPKLGGPKVIAKIDLDAINQSTRPAKKAKAAKTATTPKKTETPAPSKVEKKATPVVTEAKKETPKVVTPPAVTPPAAVAPAAPEGVEHIEMRAPKLEGPKIIGKIELPVADSRPGNKKEKRKRKRIPVDNKATEGTANANTANRKPGEGNNRFQGGRTGTGAPFDRNKRGPAPRPGANNRPGAANKPVGTPAEIDAKEIQDKIRETQAKLAGNAPKHGRQMKSKYRRSKREEMAERRVAEEESETGVIQVTEFISVSEFASLLDVSFTDIISKCMGLGIMVSINQRLDAEVIELVAGEFDREVEFIDLLDQEVEDGDDDEEDDVADMIDRAPVVTIMGHVDHGKTSLLDYIRHATVVAGEAGGITQHIGAYKVKTASGKEVTFLDTPGHEAFTAMRARGAKAADIAVIVIAADDAIMPQTREAISHAQAASLPMVFAINKIDKEGANPEKIKEQLSSMNILLEDWGGKFQSQEISAKKGINIDILLEKILLESELLELKANPKRKSIGTIIEASLDKGRGYVTSVLVQGGELKQGDMMLAGQYYGKVKAMFNERGQRVEKAGPSTPVQILGLNGAPQAGEKFKIYDGETEAKNIATHRAQILREQGLRSRKHITLDEIGRRLALGNFKELNVIIKADFDGSAEALSDSLQKLSTDEVVVNVVLKGVGQISESDIMLASASDAIILGFQVRASSQATRVADQENIEIRYYSIIYDAIEEIKSAMEGMLEPSIEKKIVGNIEVREVFKITGLGTIAGSYVLDGKFSRNTKINIIRDGIVVHNGELSGLKRYKDDVKEVVVGYECGVSIKNFSDIKVGDILEGYEDVEVKRKL